MRDTLIFSAGILWTISMLATLILSATSGGAERGSGRITPPQFSATSEADDPEDGRQDKKKKNKEAVAFGSDE